MKVLLIRHFKVYHHLKKRCYCSEFYEDIESYNTKPLINTKELDFPIDTVYISTLERTEETARFLKGEKTIIKTSLINEVDLSGSSRIKLRLPIMMWYGISTVKWRLNSSKQKETHKDTIKRATEFLRILEEKNEDCIVISHGMFLIELIKIMMKKGYNGGTKEKRLENGEVVILSKRGSAV